MGEIIYIEEYRPHRAGLVLCDTCFYVWVGVAPVGTDNLECPTCGEFDGHYICKEE